MHASNKSTIRELPSVAPVSRTRTLAGGYKMELSKLPAHPSGRTGTDGDLLMPELADAELEARRLYFEIGHAHVVLGEELLGERFVVSEERIKALMMRLDDLRRYVMVLAKQRVTPNVCPRCQSEPTSDPTGDTMCGGCVSATYGRTVIR